METQFPCWCMVHPQHCHGTNSPLVLATNGGRLWLQEPPLHVTNIPRFLEPLLVGWGRPSTSTGLFLDSPGVRGSFVGLTWTKGIIFHVWRTVNSSIGVPWTVGLSVKCRTVNSSIGMRTNGGIARLVWGCRRDSSIGVPWTQVVIVCQVWRVRQSSVKSRIGVP